MIANICADTPHKPVLPINHPVQYCIYIVLQCRVFSRHKASFKRWKITFKNHQCGTHFKIVVSIFLFGLLFYIQRWRYKLNCWCIYWYYFIVDMIITRGIIQKKFLIVSINQCHYGWMKKCFCFCFLYLDCLRKSRCIVLTFLLTSLKTTESHQMYLCLL